MEFEPITNSINRGVAPGGFIKIKDMDFVPLSDDDNLPQDSDILQLYNILLEGAKLGGVNPRISSAEIKAKMWKAGLANATVHHFRIPVGPWPKDKHLKEVG
jgi:hypothetical protein